MLLWVAAALAFAVVISPWLYQGGKGYAELAAARGFTGVAGWLGMACQRAEFGRFFNRSVLLGSLLWLPLLFRRLGSLRQAGGRTLPAGAPEPWRRGASLWLLGLLLAGGVLWVLGMVASGLGAFTANPAMPGLKVLLTQAVLPAVMVSVVEEGLFRGLLLGLWLRVARPLSACIGSSVVFAFLHFLGPRSGTGIAEPAAALAGLRHVGGILRHFTEPRIFAADFLTLFALGLILAGARLRTGGLWLCIGMHSGWVIAFKAYNLTHQKVCDGPLSGWWIGDTLRSGLLPLAALGITAGLCHLVLKGVGYQSKVTPVNTPVPAPLIGVPPQAAEGLDNS